MSDKFHLRFSNGGFSLKMMNNDSTKKYVIGSCSEDECSEDYENAFSEYSDSEIFGNIKNEQDLDYDEIVFSVEDVDSIRSEQSQRVRKVMGLTGLEYDAASLLLRHFKWDEEQVLEKFLDDPDKVCKDVGYYDGTKHHENRIKLINFSCEICCEEEQNMESLGLLCGHRYCMNCYKRYLSDKILEYRDPDIKCPSPYCNLKLSKEVIKLSVTEQVFEIYQRIFDEQFLQQTALHRWCPAPNCDKVILCRTKWNSKLNSAPSVQCRCGLFFCFTCGLQDHLPCPCTLAKAWLKKNADDSKTANWISANTKECPKCMSTIEKNGGCNHMTCKKCKYEFCWVCMGPWSEHGTSWYNCNRYDEKSSVKARECKAISRVSLERYLHYYNRYANHLHSAKLEKELFSKIEKKMTQIQIASELSWVEVQFLKSAIDTLVQCRRTLQWTYVFAYYLCKDNMTVLFEDNQRDLELAVEILSELCEKPLDLASLPNLKQNILDRTLYVKGRSKTLLQDTAIGLKEGRWKFTSIV